MARGLRRGTRAVLLSSAIILLMALSPGSALGAGSGGVRVGVLPPLASAARTIGALAASEPLRVTIVLKPRNARALDAYVRAVSSPGSRLYHEYLTPAQFAARFGATTAELRRVGASMRAHGLIPGRPTANRLAVPVTGSAGAVERAFGVFLRRVKLAGGSRAVLASAPPVLDRSIAPEVQAVIGLTSVGSPKPLIERLSTARTRRVAHAAAAGPGPCSAAKATAAAEGAYTDDQVASAYGFSGLYAGGFEGQGKTVAVYELESFDPSDITAYQSCYGTSASVTPVAVDGGAPAGGGSGEAALDIEQVIGLAPRVRVLVYEGPNSSNDTPGSGPYDTLNAIISQDRAQVVSTSWGQCEQIQGSNALDAEQTLFEEAAVQGQSVVSATGDDGSEDCDTSNNLAVDDPGSQQFVTAVGGTSMQAAGPPPSEVVWNHPGASSGPLVGQGGAGGGGVSAAWTMPGYQSNAAKQLNVIAPYSTGSPCDNTGGYCREVPDVSADADPARGYLIYWNGNGAAVGMPEGWQAVGGTSAAAPLWAALLADADSTSGCRASTVGFANPALYEAAGSDDSKYFNDVTVGNNDYTGTNHGLYPAGTGYDMASGLGTPKADALAGALCADALRVEDPGTQISTVGQAVSLRIAATASATSRLRFYASKLPSGLSVAGTSGRITGRPKKIGTWNTGVAALDQNLSLRGAFFTWRVVGAPIVSGIRLSGAGDRRRLTFTLTAGREAPWLERISLRLAGGSRFSRPARVRVAFVGTRRRRVSWRSIDGRLRIVLGGPVWRIRITVEAVKPSAGIATTARRNRIPTGFLAVMTRDTAGLAAWARIQGRG